MTENRNLTLLAHSDVCAVERCRDCGMIHVRFGASSVCLPPAGFAALCETLSFAFCHVSELMPDVWPFPRGAR